MTFDELVRVISYVGAGGAGALGLWVKYRVQRTDGWKVVFDSLQTEVQRLNERVTHLETENATKDKLARTWEIKAHETEIENLVLRRRCEELSSVIANLEDENRRLGHVARNADVESLDERLGYNT